MNNEINVEPQEMINELLRQIAQLTEQVTLLSIVNRKVNEENKQLKEKLPKEDAS